MNKDTNTEEKKCIKHCWQGENPHRCGNCCDCGARFQPHQDKAEWIEELKKIVFEIDCSENESNYTERTLIDLFNKALLSQQDEWRKKIGRELEFYWVSKQPEAIENYIKELINSNK